MTRIDEARAIYLNVHTPEEQSTFRPLSHCQKEALGLLRDGGDSCGGLLCFTSPEFVWIPALALTVFV